MSKNSRKLFQNPYWGMNRPILKVHFWQLEKNNNFLKGQTKLYFKAELLPKCLVPGSFLHCGFTFNMRRKNLTFSNSVRPWHFQTIKNKLIFILWHLKITRLTSGFHLLMIPKTGFKLLCIPGTCWLSWMGSQIFWGFGLSFPALIRSTAQYIWAEQTQKRRRPHLSGGGRWRGENISHRHKVHKGHCKLISWFCVLVVFIYSLSLNNKHPQ